MPGHGCRDVRRDRVAEAPGHAVDAAPEKKIEEVRTKGINVPIINDGVIQGYIIAQFVFSVDGNELKKPPINPRGLPARRGVQDHLRGREGQLQTR